MKNTLTDLRFTNVSKTKLQKIINRSADLEKAVEETEININFENKKILTPQWKNTTSNVKGEKVTEESEKIYLLG